MKLVKWVGLGVAKATFAVRSCNDLLSFARYLGDFSV